MGDRSWSCTPMPRSGRPLFRAQVADIGKQSCCRLRPPLATSVPTGHERGELKNPVARLREQQYFSRRVLAGSATAGALCETTPRGRQDSIVRDVAEDSAMYYNRYRDTLVR